MQARRPPWPDVTVPTGVSAALCPTQNTIRVVDDLAHVLPLLEVGAGKETPLEPIDERVPNFARGEVEGFNGPTDLP